MGILLLIVKEADVVERIMGEIVDVVRLIPQECLQRGRAGRGSRCRAR